MRKKMSTPISLRLPDRLEKALRKLSITTDRPRTYLICKAIETYLSEYADYQMALERLRDKSDAIVSSSELKKRLYLLNRIRAEIAIENMAKQARKKALDRLTMEEIDEIIEKSKRK